MDSSIVPVARPAGEPRRRRLPILLLLVVALTSGCTSFRPIPVDAIVDEVALGDIVRVTVKDGSRREFQVVSVGADSLGGVDVTIPTQDIVFVEHKRVDVARSFGAGLAGVVGGAVALFALAMTTALVVVIAAA